MARFSAVLAIIAVLATEAAAFPINPRTLANRNLAKRIAQTTIDAPKKWEDACVRTYLVTLELARSNSKPSDCRRWSRQVQPNRSHRRSDTARCRRPLRAAGQR